MSDLGTDAAERHLAVHQQTVWRHPVRLHRGLDATTSLHSSMSDNVAVRLVAQIHNTKQPSTTSRRKYTKYFWDISHGKTEIVQKCAVLGESRREMPRWHFSNRGKCNAEENSQRTVDGLTSKRAPIDALRRAHFYRATLVAATWSRGSDESRMWLLAALWGIVVPKPEEREREREREGGERERARVKLCWDKEGEKRKKKKRHHTRWREYGSRDGHYHLGCEANLRCIANEVRSTCTLHQTDEAKWRPEMRCTHKVSYINMQMRKKHCEPPVPLSTHGSLDTRQISARPTLKRRLQLRCLKGFFFFIWGQRKTDWWVGTTDCAAALPSNYQWCTNTPPTPHTHGS